MSNKKQSSIEWFIQQFNGKTSRIANMIGVKKYNSIIKQAKAMHKEEIIDAWSNATTYEKKFSLPSQYYYEIFGGQDE